jgi:hypothetical protein
MMMNDVVSICAMWCDVVRCRGTDVRDGCDVAGLMCVMGAMSRD